MKLITELFEDVETVLEEGADGKKSMFIQGVFLQSAIKNRNGRVYPEQVMDAAVNKYIAEQVQTKRAMGELGHPAGPQINLDRVSHLIVSLQKEGTNYIGKAKLMDTPFGNIAKGLVGDGVNLGVSSRGLGSLKPTGGIMEVQSDFRIATAADIVADPSAPDAFVQGIMEGVEYIYDEAKNAFIEQKIDETRKVIQTVSVKELNERKIQLWESFLEVLKRGEKL